MSRQKLRLGMWQLDQPCALYSCRRSVSLRICVAPAAAADSLHPLHPVRSYSLQERLWKQAAAVAIAYEIARMRGK